MKNGMRLTKAQAALRRDMELRVPQYDAIPSAPAATVPLSLYLDLLAKYDALKRDGFVAEPVVAPTEDVPGFPTLIDEAVTQRAVDSASRRTLEQFARTQLKKGESPQDVATAILAGEDLEDG